MARLLISGVLLLGFCTQMNGQFAFSNPMSFIRGLSSAIRAAQNEPRESGNTLGYQPATHSPDVADQYGNANPNVSLKTEEAKPKDGLQQNSEMGRSEEQSELPKNVQDQSAFNINSFPTASICLREEQDRIPKNLAKVLENPRKYIPGPDSNIKSAEKEIVIVGAGMAGLTSAYILLNAGHKVTILEASDRVGGRVYTKYEDGYYMDFGAMRFPQYHFVVQKAFEIFKVATAPFTNYDEGEQGNYYVINGEYIPTSVLNTQEKLREVYLEFGIPEENIPKDKDGQIIKIDKLLYDILEEETQVSSHCTDDKSLHAFLREKCLEKGIDEKIIFLWATLTQNVPYLTYTVDEFLVDSDQRELNKELTHETFLEVVNGTSALVNAILPKLEKFPKFKLLMNSPVYKIDNSFPPDQKMKVFYGQKGDSESTESPDEIIITTTAKAVDLIDFVNPLPYWKQMALANLKYFNAAKIFLKFKSAFWSRKENNKAEPILYGKYDGKFKLGATGTTDNHLIATYYPSHDFHGPVIIASYTWDNQADFWDAYNETQTYELALKELEVVHGPIVWEEFERGHMVVWDKNIYSHGAFVQQEPFQKYNFMSHLMSPVGNIYFSGEYTNKEYNGWIEAAVESAIRVLVNQNPTEYLKEFGQEEHDFITRKNREVRRRVKRGAYQF